MYLGAQSTLGDTGSLNKVYDDDDDDDDDDVLDLFSRSACLFVFHREKDLSAGPFHPAQLEFEPVLSRSLGKETVARG